MMSAHHVAMDNEGRLFVATHGERHTANWERLPLIPGGMLRHRPVDALLFPGVPKPNWAIDVYIMPVGEATALVLAE